MSRSSLLPKILAILLTFTVFYAVMILLLRAIGLENAHQFIQQAGGWAPFVFVMLCALSLVIAPLSGSSIFIVGGTLFDKEQALLLGFIASILGCSINFWMSRKMGRGMVAHLIGKNHLEKLDRFTKRLEGHRGIFYLTLMMPLAQDMISYAAGLTPLSYSRFAIALILSTVPLVTTYVYLGSSLLEALI